MKGKRKGLDFDKHELHITNEGGATIHYLAVPNTSSNAFRFINIQNVLVVTGDFGNWVFSRSFIPSPSKERVSDSYWNEKLETYSTQKSTVYDQDVTINWVKEVIGEYEDLTEEEIAYLNGCIYNSDSEHDYNSYAYDPSNRCGRFEHDCENIPKAGHVTHHWLLYIYDAYEEICRRLLEASAVGLAHIKPITSNSMVK